MAAITKTAQAAADGLVLALGGLCLAAALAAQGGRFSVRLDLLTHFSPFWLVGALFAAGYGLLFASPALRLGLIVIGVVAAMAAAALMLSELTRPIRPRVAGDGAHQIKLIQFNAWDRNVDIDVTADWIVRQNPDFVLMEDVQPPIRQALERRGLHYTRGMVRTAIFSRIAPAPAPFFIPEHDWHVLPDFARATFSSAGGPFSLVAIHLSWPTEADQQDRGLALGELLDRYPADRLILAGDFNLTPWSFVLHRLEERYRLERRDRALFSWPARLSPDGRLRSPVPFLPIDHVYAGSAWRTVSIERGPLLGSDHYPLVAVLALED
jgi:endonuclease/exonuclease/phosphatase (EEP) superfamily protein YafD